MLNIAIVYLGKNVPTYVYRNLAKMVRDFPDHPTYFVSDNEAALSKAKLTGSKVFKVDMNNQSAAELVTNLKHPRDFRKGFWLYTTGRFFALEELSKFLNEPIIQVEADVLLLSMFPLSKFIPINTICYPLESLNTGAASIFFIPNQTSIKEFNKFILTATEKNGFETDMTLLGSYYAQYPDKVTILPSIPPVAKQLDAKNKLYDASKNYHDFEGLFDPLTYGLYLLGEDPKNNYGKIIFGSKPKLHLISSLDLDFKVELNSLYLKFNSQEYPIYCLHIHSKNLKVFNSKTSTFELEKSIIFAKKNRIKFSFAAFFYLIIRAAQRRVLGEKNER
jgi:hypothetical protein